MLHTSVSLAAAAQTQNIEPAESALSAAPKFVRLPSRGAGADPRLRALKADARTSLRGGRAQQAYRALRQRLESGRTDPEFLGLLAVASLAVGYHDEAQVLYEHLLHLQPQEQRWQRGWQLAQSGAPPPNMVARR